MTDPTVLCASSNGVTTITLNQPKKLNALSSTLLLELHGALTSAAADPACRCILLTGTGRGFSAGADLSDPGGIQIQPGESLDLASALRERYHPVIELIRETPKPVIAAVNGVAAGAGCNLALAADIVLSARSARFIQAFVRIGLIPDAGGTWTIPRLIGRARTMRWMMTGETIDAQTAADWGLISTVHEDDQLMAEAQELAERLASGPTRAIAAIKNLVDASMQNPLGDQLEEEALAQYAMGGTKDAQEGILAFLQKRDARFRGE